MKLKFAGLIRSLLGKGESGQPEPTTAPERQVSQPPAFASNPQSDQASASPYYSSSSENSPDPSTLPDPDHPDEIAVSLLAIANSLPMDLKAKLIGTPAPGRMVYLPLENVISQLAFGAVKISFGDLRSFVPGIFVSGLNDTYDSRLVSLPLNEILARINPALLARRPATQKLEVGEEITGPFAGHGRGVSFTEKPLTAPPVRPATPTHSLMPGLPSQPKRDIKPAFPSLPSRENKPITPISFAPKPAPAAPPNPFTAPAKPVNNANPNIISRSNGNGKSSGNGNGHAKGNGNGHGLGDQNKSNAGPALPPFKFTTTPAPFPAASVPPMAAPVSNTAPAPAPKPATKPKMPAGPQPTVSVWLQELAEKWPDEIKSEIDASGLGSAKVPLPLPVVEPGLKRGRVTMAWREIRTLINPNSPPSTVDDLELDLPLHVVAPAFLAAQRKLSAQAPGRMAVSEEIPNLFFGFPQPETPAPTAPVTLGSVAPPPAAPVFRPTPLPRKAPAPDEIAEAAVPNSPLQNAARNGDTNLYPAGGNGVGQSGDSTLLERSSSPPTDFLSRQMQPKDVVAQALALPGVAGAVVALADGLRVAGEVPPEVNTDTVAAFLPQIYERVNQCTRELRMGTLNNVSFTVGNVPWKIFRVNSIYFAVFGRADEPFPKAELALLASGLNRKSK